MYYQAECEEGELKLKKLESGSIRLQLDHSCGDPADMFPPERSRHPSFGVSYCIQLVPRFCEKDAEKFFLDFEKMAKKLKWPEKFWSVVVQSTFIGKA